MPILRESSVSPPSSSWQAGQSPW